MDIESSSGWAIVELVGRQSAVMRVQKELNEYVADLLKVARPTGTPAAESDLYTPGEQ